MKICPVHPVIEVYNGRRRRRRAGAWWVEGDTLVVVLSDGRVFEIRTS